MIKYKRSDANQSDLTQGFNGENVYFRHLGENLDDNIFDVFNLNRNKESMRTGDFLVHDKSIDFLTAIELETKGGIHHEGVYKSILNPEFRKKTVYKDLTIPLKGFDTLISRTFTIPGNPLIQNRKADAIKFVSINEFEANEGMLKRFFVVDIYKTIIPIIKDGYENNPKIEPRTGKRGREPYFILQFDEFKLYDYTN
jgi:hypothetical protein